MRIDRAGDEWSQDEDETHGWTDDLDAVTIILLIGVAVFGLLTIAAQVGMWIGRQ